LKHIRIFKTDLTELAIALLFILLAANLRIANFVALGWKGIILILAVLFLIRPLSVVICSFGTSLSFRERAFLSWIAPRGIVAGSMASLFALQLKTTGQPGAPFLEAFTFAVIGSTILLQGLSAGAVAGWLKVREEKKQGWLIVGAHYFSHKIAAFISKVSGRPCILVDSNAGAIHQARMEGFKAVEANALSPETIPTEVLTCVGSVLALTDNQDLNELICVNWSEYVAKDRLFRWSSRKRERTASSGAVGIPVWSNLNKPSSIAYDLKHKEAQIHTFSLGNARKERKGALNLLIGIDGLLSFQLPEAGTANGHALQLQQLTYHLPMVVRPEFVISGENFTVPELLDQLIDIAIQAYPKLSKSDLQNSLLERELKFPTILSHGVVVPHTRCSDLPDPICLIARIPKGIDYPNPGCAKAHLVFLLLSSAEDPEMHLILLAEIAKVASDPEIVERLLKMSNGNKIIRYLIDDVFSE
jgi:mannitol/fructose-specific phosphotransferase system IIA component (Ntr-type)